MRTGYELDANWERAFQVRGYQDNLYWRGQGGESVAGKAKGVLIGGLKKRNAETEQEETGQ